MERFILLIAVAAIVYSLVRDIVDLFSSRERGQSSDLVNEPEIRYFQPDAASPALDYAKLGFAYLIDLLPFIAVVLIVHLAFMPLGNLNPSGVEATPDGIDTLVDAMIALFAIIASYTVTRGLHVVLVAKTGRSLGWFVTGYKVVEDDGSPPAFWSYLSRSFDDLRTSRWASSHSGGRSNSRIRYIARECKLIATA